MDDYSAFIPQVHFEQIPIKNLVSNQDYQRNLSMSHIEKAAANFDVYQINPVKVSRRNGINYVFNGQHTIEIVAMVSGSRDTPVWCMIYDDLNYQHEANIFANQMKYVKPLAPYEVFKANLEAQNDVQIIISELVARYHLQIGTKRGNGVICAVSTVESIFMKYGYSVLDRTLQLCVMTWEGDYNSFSANIMNAISKLVITYEDELDDEVFKEKIGAISVKQLGRTAKERRPGSMGYAEAMVILYNGRRKNRHTRLSLKKLYMREGKLNRRDDEYDDYDEYEDEEE